MGFILDKDNFTFPIYKSIANQIEQQIQNKTLKGGEKLPTERDLSLKTGISRGTIKAAFAEMQNKGIIRTVQGSGSFVSETAVEQLKGPDDVIDGFFSEMRAQGFSLQEIETKFTKRLLQLYDQVTKVRIAWVDTCPEFINAAMTDISKMRCITTDTFINTEVSLNPALLNDFDMIVIGWKNFEEFVRHAKIDTDKLEKVTLNLKMSCIINLAKVPQEKRTAVWCMSDKFIQVMQNVLVDFENIHISEKAVGLCAPQSLMSMLERNDVLLLPPEMYTPKNSGYSEAIERFQSKGGIVIPFEYQLDRGSIVHLEDRVKEIFYSFNEKDNKILEE